MGQMPRRKALRPLDSGLRRNDGFTNAAGRDVLMSERSNACDGALADLLRSRDSD